MIGGDGRGQWKFDIRYPASFLCLSTNQVAAISGLDLAQSNPIITDAQLIGKTFGTTQKTSASMCH